MQDFAGRVAVVTGGASGIGLGLARRFGAEGMRVVIGDVEPQVHVSVLCPGWVNTRIAESERNRPERLVVAGAEGGGPGPALLQDVLARGMAPDAVADQVLAAIRDERFWILSHDTEADTWVDTVNPARPVPHRPPGSRVRLPVVIGPL